MLLLFSFRAEVPEDRDLVSMQLESSEIQTRHVYHSLKTVVLPSLYAAQQLFREDPRSIWMPNGHLLSEVPAQEVSRQVAALLRPVSER